MKKFLSIISFAFLLVSCTEVENGYRGVVYKPYSGGLDPEQVYPEGVDVGVSWMWNDMITYDCRQHTTTIKTTILDKDQLDVPIEASAFHRVIPDRIGYLHLEKGADYEETYILPNFRGILQNIVGRYSAEEIVTSKRQQVQTEVEELLREELAKNNLLLDDVIIEDIDLPERISRAIEAKQEQEQRNLLAEKKKVEAENLAAARVATAKGEAEAAIYEQQARTRLSTPALLRLKELENDATWAKQGKSKYGSNNVFGSDVGILKGLSN